MTMPEKIPGLHAIAGYYDALICDVWGVVHDGYRPNAGAVDALQAFRASSGPVVLLTNAPRLAADVMAQFDRIGVPHDCYDALVTSGEAARAELARRAGNGRELALFNLGPERDRAVREGLNIRLADADRAELVLCTGLFDDEREGPQDYRALLEKFRARKLTLLCANPDVTVKRGDSIVYCAGAIAGLYEEMGGAAVYFGKPYAPVFEHALARARTFGAARRVLAAGDGLATDIRGANAMGWDALFVPKGEDRTFAEMAPAEKDRVSHRGLAWAEMARKMR